MSVSKKFSLMRTQPSNAIPVRQQVQIKTAKQHNQFIISQLKIDFNEIQLLCSNKCKDQIDLLKQYVKDYCEAKQILSSELTKTMKQCFKIFYYNYLELFDISQFIENNRLIENCDITNYESFTLDMIKGRQALDLQQVIQNTCQVEHIEFQYSETTNLRNYFLLAIQELYSKDQLLIKQKQGLIKRFETTFLDIQKEQTLLEQESCKYQEMLENQENTNIDYIDQQKYLGDYDELIDRINIVIPEFRELVSNLEHLSVMNYQFQQLVSEIITQYSFDTELTQEFLAQYIQDHSTSVSQERARLLTCLLSKMESLQGKSVSVLRTHVLFRNEVKEISTRINNIIILKYDYFVSTLQSQIVNKLNFAQQLDCYFQYISRHQVLSKQYIENQKLELDIVGNDYQRKCDDFQQRQSLLDDEYKDSEMQKLLQQNQQLKNDILQMLQFLDNKQYLAANVNFYLQFAEYSENENKFKILQTIYSSMLQFKQKVQEALTDIHNDLKQFFPTIDAKLNELCKICDFTIDQQQNTLTMQEAILKISNKISENWIMDEYNQNFRPVLVECLQQSQGRLPDQMKMLGDIKSTYDEVHSNIIIAQNNAIFAFQNKLIDLTIINKQKNDKSFSQFINDQTMELQSYFPIFHVNDYEDLDDELKQFEYVQIREYRENLVVSFDIGNQRCTQTRKSHLTKDKISSQTLTQMDEQSIEQYLGSSYIPDQQIVQTQKENDFAQIRWVRTKYCRVPYELTSQPQVILFVKTLLTEMRHHFRVQYIKKNVRQVITGNLFLDKSCFKFYLKVEKSTTSNTFMVENLEDLSLGQPGYIAGLQVVGHELQLQIRNVDPCILFFIDSVQRDTWLTGLTMLKRFFHQVQIEAIQYLMND